MRSGSATELSAYAYQCAITLYPRFTPLDPAIYLESGSGGSWGEPDYRDTRNTVFEG